MARSRGFPGFVFFANPFTCHLLCTEGNNGVGVAVGGWGLGICRSCLLCWHGESNGCCPRVLAAGASPTNPTTVIHEHDMARNEAGNRK